MRFVECMLNHSYLSSTTLCMPPAVVRQTRHTQRPITRLRYTYVKRPRRILMITDPQAWSTSLPPALHFDQDRLGLAVLRLNSTVPETSMSGFLYAYMHIMAECGMLYVQAAKASVTSMESTSSAMMLRTMENISILMDHLTPRGRESYLSKYPCPLQ